MVFHSFKYSSFDAWIYLLSLLVFFVLTKCGKYFCKCYQNSSQYTRDPQCVESYICLPREFYLEQLFYCTLQFFSMFGFLAKYKIATTENTGNYPYCRYFLLSPSRCVSIRSINYAKFVIVSLVMENPHMALVRGNGCANVAPWGNSSPASSC